MFLIMFLIILTVVDFLLMLSFLASKQIKDEILKRKHKIEELTYFYGNINISDMNEEKNVALLKYETGHLVTAFSFIG